MRASTFLVFCILGTLAGACSIETGPSESASSGEAASGKADETGVGPLDHVTKMPVPKAYGDADCSAERIAQEYPTAYAQRTTLAAKLAEMSCLEHGFETCEPELATRKEDWTAVCHAWASSYGSGMAAEPPSFFWERGEVRRPYGDTYCQQLDLMDGLATTRSSMTQNALRACRRAGFADCSVFVESYVVNELDFDIKEIDGQLVRTGRSKWASGDDCEVGVIIVGR